MSLLSNFFVTPWTTAAPGLTAADQSWVIGQAAFSLRALGRQREAIGAIHTAAEATAGTEFWNTAVWLSNLSELQLALGNIGEAIDAAQRSVEAADRRGDGFQQMVNRATLADALRQSGDLNAATQLFRQAEKMQAKRQEAHPVLYSHPGYLYCDLLLAQGRRDEVLGRATRTIAIAERNNWLLDMALDHLSLAGAHSSDAAEAADHFNQAVGGLRRAGQLDDLPRGLLARATHFRHTGDFDKAQHDLDEVRVLTTRCGMRLFLADYHLEQARLLLVQQKPEGARPHYESARSLVDETGYHRRHPDLAELETQLNMKPASA